jgi:phage gp29-like protein
MKKNRTVADYSTKAKDENKTLTVADIKKLYVRKNNKHVISSIGGWDVQMVRSAIEQASIGDFEQVSKLSRKMMADAAFSAAINKRINSLIRSEFFMEPSEQDSSASKVIADSILDIWFDAIPELTIKNLLKSYLLVGVAVAFVTWKNKEGIFYPELEVLNTEFLKYNQSDCKWTYRTASEPVEVEPGNGNWILIKEWEPGNVVGFCSQLGECWVNKKFAEKDQAVGNENHIDSICVVTDNGSGVNQEQSTLDDFADEIQSKKRDRVITLPLGYSVSFQDSMSSYKPEAFSNVIDYCDKKIQISILGGNLSSEVVGGSYSAAQTHHGVELDLTSGDEAIMSTELHKQLIQHVVSVNYGPECSKQYCPWPHWKTQQEEDLNSTIDTLLKIKEFVGDGMEIENIQDLLLPFNVKLKEKINVQ